MSVALKLSNLCEEKIVVEKAKEFKESVFWPVYQRTKVLLEDIILRDQGQDDDVYLSSDRKPVISFVGRRGTGKTSAMMSVHNALKSKEELKGFLSDKYIRDSSFIVLDYIDVSTMEKGEDILEIVLANMFSLFLKREQQSQRTNTSYESRELYRMFDEIYGSLISIKDMRGRKSDISPLSQLTQLSNSQVLKVKIEELIKKYLQYMEGDQEGYAPAKQKFLVITIDDLDMSFQNETEFPFEILETLHRYLMTTGVIILATYNFSDLCSGCEKHFMKIFSDRKGALISNESGIVKHLTQEYLKKVLPMYNRVHLPSLKKSDYVDEVRPRIEMQPDEVKELFGGLKKNILKDDAKASFILDPKKFVMLLRGSVAGLYYDVNGVKKHFVEPSQLRELVQTYTFFEQLNKLKHSGKNEEDNVRQRDVEKGNNNKPEESAENEDFCAIFEQFNKTKGSSSNEENNIREHDTEKVYVDLEKAYVFFEQLCKLKRNGKDGKANPRQHDDENEDSDKQDYNVKNEDIIFKALLDNLYFEFAKSNLAGEEQELFEDFLKVPLERRSKDILMTLRVKAKENLKASEMSCILYKSGAKESYSYGELIYGLYLASKNGWFKKQLVWCILDSYTIMLTKYYRHMKKTKDLSEKAKWKKKILDVLGMSVASSWSNCFVPKLSIAASESEVEERNRLEYGVYDRENITQCFAAVKFGGGFVQWDFELSEINKEISLKINKEVCLQKQLQLLEFMAMFFTNVKCRTEKGGVHQGFDIVYNGYEEDRGKWIYQSLDLNKGRSLRFKMTDGCFNIFNFVYNLLDSENFFRHLHENLKKAYKDYFKDIDMLDVSIDKFFEKNSMKAKYQDWFRRTQGFALPVYSFDMIYNLFKRQFQNLGLMPDSVYINDCWIYIKECFKEFGKLLEDEDKFYFSTLSDERINDGNIGNVEIDSNNKWFFNAYNDSPFIHMIHEMENKELENYFKKQFVNMLYGMV